MPEVNTRSAANEQWPRIGVVGPLPPPSGGMANQCEQLTRLLREEGVEVELVRSNAPYQPAWVGRLPVIRAVFRLLPFVVRLWRTCGKIDVLHVLANSGWSFHLITVPSVVIARLRRVGVIVNYRGGEAARFFARAPRLVFRVLSAATLRVTPSAFLLRIFRQYGLDAEVIPNIIDLNRFAARKTLREASAPHLIVTRNLEPIYDIPTALKAFSEIRAHHPHARMTIAGEGPEREALKKLAQTLNVAESVTFAGRIDNADIPTLYADADLMLNPSTVDNMPISILEAYASGIPVVTTNVGGIPDVVEHGRTGLLVDAGDYLGMAEQALTILRNPDLAERLRSGGRMEAERYAWPYIKELWHGIYLRACSSKYCRADDRNQSV